MSQIEILDVISQGHGTLESPIWTEKYGLVVSDATLGGVFSISDNGKRQDIVQHRRGIGGFAFHENGGIIVGGRNLALKRPVMEGESETVVLLSNDVDSDIVGFNDLTVDSVGRIYVGSLCFVATEQRYGKAGDLFVVDLDGTSRIVADDIQLTNGLCFSPDGTILYHADSLRHSVYAYKVKSNGDLGPRQIFLESEVGMPDGITVDQAGTVWVALPHSGAAEAYSPSGEKLHELRIEEPMITSMGYGGSDMCDFYIVSGSEGLDTDVGGKVYKTRLNVPGLSKPLAKMSY